MILFERVINCYFYHKLQLIDFRNTPFCLIVFSLVGSKSSVSSESSSFGSAIIVEVFCQIVVSRWFPSWWRSRFVFFLVSLKFFTSVAFTLSLVRSCVEEVHECSLSVLEVPKYLLHENLHHVNRLSLTCTFLPVYLHSASLWRNIECWC